VGAALRGHRYGGAATRVWRRGREAAALEEGEEVAALERGEGEIKAFW
jgi:hypothetical protein